MYNDTTMTISGTRDSFGISKAFYDPKTSKDIDTWKKWEKAGFRNPLESEFKKNPDVKDKIKWNMKRKPKQTKPSKAIAHAEMV